MDEYREAAYWPASQRLRPLVVITSLASLNGGFARQLLREFSARDQNELIFVEKQGGYVPSESIAAQILDGYRSFPLTEISSIETKQEVPSIINAISALAPEPEKKNSVSKLQIIQSESEANKRKLSIEEEMKEFKETFRNRRLEKLYRK